MEIKDNETIGLKAIIVRYLLHWKLFVAAFLVSVIPAVLYILLYPRTYEVIATIQIQEDKDLGGGGFGLGEAAGLMKSFGLGGATGAGINIDDELSTLTSNQLLSQMVSELGLDVEYSKPFSFGYLLYNQSPLIITTDSATRANIDDEIEFKVKSKSDKIEVVVEGGGVKKKKFTFATLPSEIELPAGNFMLRRSGSYETAEPLKMNITFKPAGWVAEKLSDEFLIEESSKTSNIIELSCTDYEKERGRDMLNVLIERYNRNADVYKKDEASKTLLFLDDRIKTVVRDLASVESQIERYKSTNKLMDIEHDVQFYVDQMKDLQTKLIELEAQVNVIEMMDVFVKDPNNKYSLIPVLFTAQEGDKGSPMTNYNEVLLERARIIQNSSINNPLVSSLNDQADKLRLSVIETIGNAKKGLDMTILDIKGKEKLIYEKMNNYPVAERQFVDLKRQQEINQGVYLILLQKREETALILGQTRDKAKIIDTAYVKSRPIAPRKLYAAIGMILFTLIFPVCFLFCKDQYLSLRKAYLKEKRK